MPGTLDVMDPIAGHVTLEWDPDDADQLAQAQAEFDRLASCGYWFFHVAEGGSERRIGRWSGKGQGTAKRLGRLVVRAGALVEKVDTLRRTGRTVASPRMRGG